MVDESAPPDSAEPIEGAPRSGKRPRDPELGAEIQQMLIELEPYRGRIFNGPTDTVQLLAAIAAAGGPAALVAREAIRQAGETRRERLRQDGMTQRVLLTGRPEQAQPVPTSPAGDSEPGGG